jgi:hypothetical protein
MEENALSDTRLTLEKGSALIEVVQRIKGNTVKIRVQGDIAVIEKEGLYRVDADDSELRVYGGTALVMSQGKKATVKKGQIIRLNQNLKAAGFDAGPPDMLHRWSAQRSFELFMQNAGISSQKHWVPISLGWLMNYNYRTRFHLESWMTERGSPEERPVIDAELPVLKQAIDDEAANPPSLDSVVPTPGK